MALLQGVSWAISSDSTDMERSTSHRSFGPQRSAVITKPPPELRTTPENFKHVDKLLDIIEWSLRSPIESPQAEVREFSQLSDTDPPKCPSIVNPNEEAEARSLSGQSSIVDSSEGGNHTSNSSASSLDEFSQQPRNPSGRWSRLQCLKKGVRSSTADLLSSIKEVGGRDQGLRATKTVPVKVNSARTSPNFRECTSCFEDLSVSESKILPCTHAYCKTCLVTLIMTAIKDESLFPPKCCLSVIPLHQILFVLDANQRELYKSKSAEYSIPANNRWYCPNTPCLKWIPSTRLQWLRNASVKCPHCATNICSTCRGAAHKNRMDCPQDYGLEATLQVAEAEGWRRCFSCHAMVELTAGCRHITCHCRAQFCYVCGAKWRTCRCTETDQINHQALLRERRAERNAVAQAEADEIAQAIAEVEAMERIEEEERIRQQQEQELERQREEAELARLEQMRLEEEALRQQEAEKAEKDLRQAAILSIQQSSENLIIVLSEVACFQKRAIDNRYLLKEQRIEKEHRATCERLQTYADSLIHKIRHNSEKRKTVLLEKQNLDLCNLSHQHEEREDDLFLQIQLHLRGKTNREAREKRMQENLTKQHEEERKGLLEKHESQLHTLERVAKMEVQGIEYSNAARLTKAIRDHRREVRKISKDSNGDRAWFEIVTERRVSMAREHRLLLLQQVEAGTELIGLTEEAASHIEPHIPPGSNRSGSLRGVASANKVSKDQESPSGFTPVDMLLKLPENKGISRTASVRNRGSSRACKKLADSINLEDTWSFAALEMPGDHQKRYSELINSAWNWMTGSNYPSTWGDLSEDSRKEAKRSIEDWSQESTNGSVQSTPEILAVDRKADDTSSTRCTGSVTNEKQETASPRVSSEIPTRRVDTNPYRRPRLGQVANPSPDKISLTPEIAAIIPSISITNDMPSPPGAFPLTTTQNSLDLDVTPQVVGALELPCPRELDSNDSITVEKRASMTSLGAPSFTPTISTTSSSGSGISRNWPKWPLRRYRADRCTDEQIREIIKANGRDRSVR